MKGTPITPKQINTAITHLQDVINREGSASVIWSLEVTFGEGYFAESHHIEKVVGSITKSSEYIETMRGGDYEIRRNPKFELYESAKKANQSFQKLNDNILPKNFESQRKSDNKSFWLAFVSVFFIGVTIVFQLKDKTSKRLIDLQEEIKGASNKLDSIRFAIDKLKTVPLAPSNIQIKKEK